MLIAYWYVRPCMYAHWHHHHLLHIYIYILLLLLIHLSSHNKCCLSSPVPHSYLLKCIIGNYRSPCSCNTSFQMRARDFWLRQNGGRRLVISIITCCRLLRDMRPWIYRVMKTRELVLTYMYTRGGFRAYHYSIVILILSNSHFP